MGFCCHITDTGQRDEPALRRSGSSATERRLCRLLVFMGSFLPLFSAHQSGDAQEFFRCVSYNILNDQYVNASYYPLVPQHSPIWGQRALRILAQLRDVDADVLCLQEVEPRQFDLLRTGLADLGFQGLYGAKASGLDGEAIFYQERRLRFICGETHLCPGTSKCGKLAIRPLIVAYFELPSHKVLKVLNVHVGWQPTYGMQAGCPALQHVSYVIHQLSQGPSSDYQLIAGDLNCGPDQPPYKRIEATGLIDVYSHAPQPTFSSNLGLQRIDYIWCSQGMQATVRPLPDLEQLGPLPQEAHPSDHLMIVADLAERACGEEVCRRLCAE